MYEYNPPHDTEWSTLKKTRRILRFIKIVLAVFVVGVFLFVSWMLISWPSHRQIFQEENSPNSNISQADNLPAEEKILKNTPEENYRYFADAVRKKDIDLALVYVDPYQRENMKQLFDKLITEDKLDEYIANELPKLER